MKLCHMLAGLMLATSIAAAAHPPTDAIYPMGKDVNDTMRESESRLDEFAKTTAVTAAINSAVATVTAAYQAADTAITSQFIALDATVGTLAADLTTLAARVTTVEGVNATQNTRLTTAEENITVLENRVEIRKAISYRYKRTWVRRKPILPRYREP